MAAYLWSSSFFSSIGVVAISDSVAFRGVDFIVQSTKDKAPLCQSSSCLTRFFLVDGVTPYYASIF